MTITTAAKEVLTPLQSAQLYEYRRVCCFLSCQCIPHEAMRRHVSAV